MMNAMMLVLVLFKDDDAGYFSRVISKCDIDTFFLEENLFKKVIPDTLTRHLNL